MKPLDFCLKFNQKVSHAIVTSIIECAHEMLIHGYDNGNFEWDNSKDNACTLFEIDIYKNGNGHEIPFCDATNVVLSIRDDKIIDDLQFKVIDIFNDKIELCDVVNGDAIFTFPLNINTEIDEGLVFQMQTESPIVPFSVENLLLLKKIGSLLDDDTED